MMHFQSITLRSLIAIFVCCTVPLNLASSLQGATCEINDSKSNENRSDSPFAGYLSFEEIEQRMATLGEAPNVELESLGKTIEGRDIWVLKISEASPDTSDEQAEVQNYKPAFLVLGNVHAPHLVGREIALRMAEHLVNAAEKDQSIQSLLDQFTFYIIPAPSPDAAEKNFRQPYREVAGNAKPTDDDRDFSIGEDPPVDLNKDGWITMMRVHDSLGTHRSHPNDPRVLIEVDRKANEPAKFRLFAEAVDADSDGQFGEDASDGVDFNRNFTFNYAFFGKGAGVHQVSEVETRAIADFAFDHPNIGVVFCFSPEDNLFHPWKSNPQADRARIKKSILTSDATYADFLAKAFQKIHGGKKAPSPPRGAGSFSEWAYFHYGRWSFASRAWWIPEVNKDSAPKETAQPTPATEEKVATEQEAKAEGSTEDSNVELAANQDASDDQDDTEVGSDSVPTTEKPLDKNDKRGQEDLNALAWFAQQGINGFVDWQLIEHPDFPDSIVEVGGFKPFYRLNPPADQIDQLVQPHVDFLNQIKAVWPELEIREFKAVELAPGLYDVTCKVVNRGFLPTQPEMGQVTREWYPIQVTLDVPAEAKWMQGSRRQSVGKLNGQGGSQELRWLFQLPASLGEDATLKLDTWSPTLHKVTAESRVESKVSK